MIRKILFSTDSLARGGKERQMAILTAALCQEGFDMIFVAKRTDSESNYFSEYGLDPDRIRTYQGFVSFYRAVSEFGPDLTVSWDTKSSFFNLLLYRLLGYRFINGSIRHGIRIFKPDQLLRTAICRLSPWVMANSHAGLQANKMKVGRKKFVLYNGVERRYSRILTSQEREELRETLMPGYRDNPVTVFSSVANFVPYKDYFTVFRALAAISREADFRYLVAGDGPMKNEIKTAVIKFGLEENVILMGRMADTSQVLFASDIFIHSSRGEGISNAILEAMQAGLPVIATDVGGTRETIYPATSHLFAFGDADALAEILRKVIRFPLFEALGSEGYREHLRRFSDEKMVSGFLDIVNRVCES